MINLYIHIPLLLNSMFILAHASHDNVKDRYTVSVYRILLLVVYQRVSHNDTITATAYKPLYSYTIQIATHSTTYLAHRNHNNV